MLYTICYFWSGGLAHAPNIFPEATGHACTSGKAPVPAMQDTTCCQNVSSCMCAAQPGQHAHHSDKSSQAEERDARDAQNVGGYKSWCPQGEAQGAPLRGSLEAPLRGARDARHARYTKDTSVTVSSPADPLQLPRFRIQARRRHGRDCSSGHGEAGQGHIYSFGGGWQLVASV